MKEKKKKRLFSDVVAVVAILFTFFMLGFCQLETLTNDGEGGGTIVHNGMVSSSSSSYSRHMQAQPKRRSLKSKPPRYRKKKSEKKKSNKGYDEDDDEPDASLPSKHGLLNTLAWGLLFPLGVMSARYLQPISDMVWFYFHISFQSMAFILGILGFSTGIELSKEFEGIGTQKHRAIAITLFTMSILQVVGLLAKLSKNNKLIKIWKVCHYSIGYLIIILGIINIFDGFDILEPARKWRWAYIGVLATLGFNILILELLIWVRFNSKREHQLKHNHLHQEL